MKVNFTNRFEVGSLASRRDALLINEMNQIERERKRERERDKKKIVGKWKNILVHY